MTGLYFNFDWEHVGRRPIDDINSSYTPQYNNFDVGLRYTHRILRELGHLADHGQQRHGCALLVHDQSGQSRGSQHRQLSGIPGHAAADPDVHEVRLLTQREIRRHAFTAWRLILYTQRACSGGSLGV